MSSFKEKVIGIVRLIPHGKVVSYGQVALYCGLPRAAREVGWILNGIDEETSLPWWRVVNNKGYLSIRGNRTADKELQKKLLSAEGIVVSDDFTLDMKRFRFLLPKDELQKLQLPDEYIQKIVEKHGV